MFTHCYIYVRRRGFGEARGGREAARRELPIILSGSTPRQRIERERCSRWRGSLDFNYKSESGFRVAMGRVSCIYTVLYYV